MYFAATQDRKGRQLKLATMGQLSCTSRSYPFSWALETPYLGYYGFTLRFGHVFENPFGTDLPADPRTHRKRQGSRGHCCFHLLKFPHVLFELRIASQTFQRLTMIYQLYCQPRINTSNIWLRWSKVYQLTEWWYELGRMEVACQCHKTTWEEINTSTVQCYSQSNSWRCFGEQVTFTIAS